MDRAPRGNRLAGIGKNLSVDTVRTSAVSIKADAAARVSPKDMPMPSALRGHRAQEDGGSAAFRVGTAVILKSASYRVVGVIASGAYS